MLMRLSSWREKLPATPRSLPLPSPLPRPRPRGFGGGGGTPSAGVVTLRLSTLPSAVASSTPKSLATRGVTEAERSIGSSACSASEFLATKPHES